MEKIMERLKNNKTVSLIKIAFISFTLLLSFIPLSSVADANTNPTVTPENGYYFDLGSGQGGWQTDGLWHITTNRAYSPTHSFWYGDENTKSYATGGANSGYLTSPPITLASNSQPVLYFWSWYQTENSQDHDKKVVQISVNDGQWTDLKQITDAQKTWNRETIDISAYAGNTIRLRFLFDTVDDKLNNFEGWYVDSIEISSGTTSTSTPQTSASTQDATAPADINLIANPGFETGSTIPVNWNFTTNNGNTPVSDSTTSHSGAKSVKISISGTSNVISGEVWSDMISSTSGATYTFSAWGKSQGAGGANNPAIRVAEFDINYKWLRQTSLYFPKGSADWNQHQTTFTTGNGTAYIGVYANIWNGYGSFWVDDVSLSQTSAPTATPDPTPAQTATPDPTPAPTATPDPANTNIIANPGFETGSTIPVNWNFATNNGNTPVSDSTTSHSGAKSVKISISGTSNVISGEVWSDMISSTSGATYTFSAWGKSQGAGGANNPAVRVAEFDINYKWLRQTNLYFPKGSADWNQQQATFITGNGTAYIGVYANIWNGYGSFWVDDVSLSQTSAQTATPDPTPAPAATSGPTPAPTATPNPTPAPTATPAPT
ncbi:hypothetical protein, partial [Candidatus Methanoperedens nitratireducens]|uniref:hypothetical protein n=1 Tax=Candidatus Methanoperedens nitratireducens TaxID=1392998 RepID=UPI001C53A347